MDVLKRMEKDIGMILCKLDRVFPPAFFDMMVHLLVHLPREALLGGPEHGRWMYPMERYIGRWKCRVKNCNCPEGSIVEAYIGSECFTFCSKYLKGVERKVCNDAGVNERAESEIASFAQHVRPIGAKKGYDLTVNELKKVRWYVLSNSKEIKYYRE